MLVEIHNNDLYNKGVEMMVRSILGKVSREIAGAKFVMAPHLHERLYEKRASLCLYQKVWFRRYGVQWGYTGSLIPRKLRDMYGLILDREVDAVLDISGYGYTDVWGPGYTSIFAKASDKWKRQGTKIVMLPQAFGPFTTTKIRDAIKTIVDNADIIFAREKVSYNHLVDVVGGQPKIKIAPDFTNLLDGKAPDNNIPKNKIVCIIPNLRMLDRTTPEISSSYVPFILSCVKYLLENGANPFFLIHEGVDDLNLAHKINGELKNEITILDEKDPLKIKGIIGECYATIGSRYHGLVSALSQGVPSLATGWSHKYEMLFKDYSFTEGLVNPAASDTEIRKKIDLIIDDKGNAEIRKRLKLQSEKLKAQTEDMWREVITVLNSN